MLVFMHEILTTPTTNMTYIGSQNYTNMVVGEHGIQTFEPIIVMLLFCVIVI
jgi:hypothetical protein